MLRESCAPVRTLADAYSGLARFRHGRDELPERTRPHERDAHTDLHREDHFRSGQHRDWAEIVISRAHAVRLAVRVAVAALSVRAVPGKVRLLRAGCVRCADALAGR